VREAAAVKRPTAVFLSSLDGQALLVSWGSRGKSLALRPRQARGMHHQPSSERLISSQRDHDRFRFADDWPKMFTFAFQGRLRGLNGEDPCGSQFCYRSQLSIFDQI
jgi:hypothetical protein